MGISQSFLQKAITSLSGTLGDVSVFAVELDERKPLRAYGFIVELQDGLGKFLLINIWFHNPHNEFSKGPALVWH